MNPVFEGRNLLFTLVLKVGWAASFAALLVRFRSFRKLVFTENRDPNQKVKLLLFLVPPLAIAIMLRLIGHNYYFFDLAMEGSFVMGLIGGRVVGLFGGSLISLLPFGFHEWLCPPMAAGIGLLAGVIREMIPEKEDIWHFGPFLFLSIPQWLWKLVRYGEGNWAMLPLFACAAFEVVWIELTNFLPSRWLFAVNPGNVGYTALVVLSSVMCVAMIVKIWNNTRIEMNLEQNQQLLLKARMDALTSQINPHFLFNTLNTVSSLIRFDPDMARGVVLKLSNILRRLLRKHETFVLLREELDFIDDYLGIEVIRFGRDKLQIFKEVDSETLDTFVPSMLLQPIVENAIKHGLAPRLAGGQIHLRILRREGRLTIEIEDNGMGMSPERLQEVYAGGIGVSNVHERLRLLYGDQFEMRIRSREGEGTQIHIDIPELAVAEPAAR